MQGPWEGLLASEKASDEALDLNAVNSCVDGILVFSWTSMPAYLGDSSPSSMVTWFIRLSLPSIRKSSGSVGWEELGTARSS